MKQSEFNTPKLKKRYVEATCQKMARGMASLDFEFKSYLDGMFGVRRQRAILHHLDRAEEAFGSFGLSSVVKSFTKNELSPLSNYNELDSEYDVTLGAALWILDKLRASGQLQKALRILPDKSNDLEAWYLPTDFYHPCYADELILSVIYLILHRYPGGTILTEECARGKQPGEVYQSLLRLLPEQDVNAACETFRTKVWELAERNMRGEACFEKAREQADKQRKTALLARGPALKPQPTGWQGLPPLDRMPRLEDLPGLAGGMAADLQLAEPERRLLEQKSRYATDFDRYLQMDWKAIRRETSRELADALAGFTLTDPYEICFALLYLLDNGDDAPWLVRSGSSLVRFARQMLPWYVDKSDWTMDEVDAWYEGMQYNGSGWLDRETPPEQVDYLHEKHDGKNLAQIIYGLSRGVVPIGLHPFERERAELIDSGMDETLARKLTDTAELLFLQKFQARLYKPFWEPEEESEQPGEEPEETPSVPAQLGGYWGKVTGTDVKKDDFTDIEIEGLRKELAAEKQQNKSLRSTLALNRQEMDSKLAKQEQELQRLRMEHRELADLRELVFIRDLPEDERERRERLEKDYSYPYSTRKRTVIFGGHDSFLRAIKPMLPDVKYVDRRVLSFDPKIIRNADVVWIQSNSMAHPQYYAIVNQCKTAGVQMRYFTFASAEKCAEQLVTEDKK